MASLRLGEAAFDDLFETHCVEKVEDIDPWLAARIGGKRGVVKIRNQWWDHVLLLEFTKSAGCFLYQAWTGYFSAMSWVGASWEIPSKEEVQTLSQKLQVVSLRKTNIDILEDENYQHFRDTYGLGKSFDCPSTERPVVQELMMQVSKFVPILKVSDSEGDKVQNRCLWELWLHAA